MQDKQNQSDYKVEKHHRLQSREAPYPNNKYAPVTAVAPVGRKMLRDEGEIPVVYCVF